MKNLIKYGSGIEVKIPCRHIEVCYEDSDYLRNNELIGFKYITINIIDSNNKRVFGTYITLTWFNNGAMHTNGGACGEFNILGNKDEKSTNQIKKKYCVLGWLINNVKELNYLLRSYDYSIIKEYDEVYYYIYKLEEEKKRKRQEEHQILSMIKIGNAFEYSNNIITIIKITPKKVYGAVTTNPGHSYQSNMTKEQFITKIKYNDLIIKQN